MNHTIAVIGAGYAGLIAANRLARHGAEVTVYTPRPSLVQRIRLHEYAVSSLESVEVPLSRLLRSDIETRLDAVRRFDPRTRTVTSAAGESRAYDGLVLATGSGEPSQPNDPAHRVSDLASARRLREVLAQDRHRLLTIVGDGLTGVELAAAAAHAGHRVTLVGLGALDAPGEGRALGRRMRTRGVRVLGQPGLRGLDDAAALGEPGAVVVDARGFVMSGLGAEAGLPVDANKRVLTAPDLSVPGFDGVVVAGDAAAVQGPLASHLRPACATAMPSGRHAASTLLAQLDGRPTTALNLGYVGRCVDLAGGQGWFQPVTARDRAWRFGVGGRAGGLAKAFINAATLRWMHDEGTQPWWYQVRPVRFGRVWSDPVAAA